VSADAAARIAVNIGGRFASGVLAALEKMVPDEPFVGCTPGSDVPDDADVLVTLLDAPDGVAQLMAPGIRWVHALSTGVDGFPFDAAADRLITCSRGASATAIAEWVLAMVLACEKDLPGSWVSAPPARWNAAALGGVSGKNLGLVGLGAIGTEVARRGLAFDMQVTAIRRTATPSPLQGVAVATSLDDVLRIADHLVVAAPATPATAHLLDRAAFARCKPGVHVVNVARGALIDQEALLDALDDGTVARASLDVVDPEPLPAGHPFYRHPLVRLSPHVSWSAPSTLPRTFELFVDNLYRYRRGDALHGIVDPAAGY
jgi:phosphoglycerate dehydrogenase-like enzyme